MTTIQERNPGASTSSPPPGPDRISELPKEILLHILGFLEMDGFLIGTTSLVSTKWRNLWKSVPVLNFPTSISRMKVNKNYGGDVPPGGGGIWNNEKKNYNFVDHVLRLRDSQASEIQIFRYNCVFAEIGYGYLERVHNFIVSAVVNQGAQEINILTGFYNNGRRDGKIIHFNPSIFTSGKLRKFSFKVINNGFIIQFPRSMCCATQLTHLNLYDIILPEGDDDHSNAELHLVCPVLDTLVLNRCYYKHLKVLHISAPRLNSLSICNNDMRNRYSDSLGGCRLEIHTPNLTSFYYSGCVFVDCFTENLPRITIANLKISNEEETHDMVRKTNSFAIKLLKGLTSASFLSLAGFEVFSRDTLSGLFTQFTRLKKLSLITSCNISSIHGMVHILNSCNSIEVLSWKVDEISTVEGDDEHLMILQSRLSHLKHVRIENLRGHENEIEFVKFLLKSSIVLEEIIINTARGSPKISIEENLKEIIEEFGSIKLQIL